MSVELRSGRKDIFLVGDISHQILGAKLPSNRQVLAVLFFNIREVKLKVRESANLVIRECIIFWEKARVPVKSTPNCVKKLMDLYHVWRDLQKNAKKIRHVFKQREYDFKNTLDNLFDIAHAEALKKIKIEEDRLFLQRQREPGRPGYIAGVDKKLTEKEERAKQREIDEEKRRMKHMAASTSSASYELSLPQEPEDTSSSNSYGEEEAMSTLSESTICESAAKRGRKDFITQKLVGTLDRCQLSIRDSVYILQATVEALGLNIDEYPINKSSIQRIRTKKRKERAESIKIDFNNDVPEVVTVHWDGKLLPAVNIRNSKEERLPIVITFGNREQLLAVPKLDNSSGKEQAQAVWMAINDWNLEDKVQILCCDTTASNTGTFKGACVLIEQMLERELIIFACRHHVYEIVLKSVFESKFHQVTISPDIPLFKMFKDCWKSININNIQTCTDIVKEYFNDNDITELLHFYHNELQKSIVRDDYRELIELSVIFLGGDANKKLKVRPPGAIHQARWMGRAIYSLKMYLLHSELKLSMKDKESLKEVCIFITTAYVKPWLKCSLAVKAPYQDLCFLKTLKAYERVDKTISTAALNKFIHHLWYLTDEIAILSLFDDEVDIQTKAKMVANLSKENISTSGKKYVPSKDEIGFSFYGKFDIYNCILYTFTNI